MINFIIPCYNEEHRMIKPLQDFCSYIRQENIVCHITFINDGSIDNSAKKLEKHMHWNQIPYTILSYSQNQWKWYAIQYGIKNSPTQCDYYFLRDIDNATSLDEIKNCIEKSKKYDVVIWKRVFPYAQRTFKRKLWQILSWWLIQKLLALPYKDTQCGCKIFRSVLKDTALIVKPMRRWRDFAFLCFAHHKWYSIYEHEVIWKDIPQGHISFKDYFITLKELLITYKQYSTWNY